MGFNPCIQVPGQNPIQVPEQNPIQVPGQNPIQVPPTWCLGKTPSRCPQPGAWAKLPGAWAKPHPGTPLKLHPGAHSAWANPIQAPGQTPFIAGTRSNSAQVIAPAKQKGHTHTTPTPTFWNHPTLLSGRLPDAWAKVGTFLKVFDGNTLPYLTQ